MGRSRSRSPARCRRHKGPATSSFRDRHTSTYRRRSRSRDRRRDDPPTSSDAKNGEIALSIDETNHLRLSLGLKPLAVGLPPSEHAVVNVQKTSAQLAAEHAQQELQTKLQQSKTRRELTQKLDGSSLGEQIKAEVVAKKTENESIHDALAWVKQVRKQGTKSDRFIQAEEDKATYEAPAFAGLTVGHALAQFEDGEHVILTLQDQPVLDNQGTAVTQDDAVLVNVEWREKERRARRQARARRAALPVYSGYDDDEFVASHRGRTRKPRSRLLAQYDEEAEAGEAEQANQFQLNAHGGTTVVGATEPAAHAAVVSLTRDRPTRDDTTSTRGNVAVPFVHRQASHKGRKHQRVRRPPDALDEAGDGGDEPVQLRARDVTARTFVAQGEPAAMQTSTTLDRGRRTYAPREADDTDDQRSRFQTARDKAHAVATEALNASATLSLKRLRRQRHTHDVMDDAGAIERDQLDASLARARAVALQSHTSSPCTREGRLAQLVHQTVRDRDDAVASATRHVFRTVETLATPVVFTHATDFESRLRDAMDKRAAQFHAAAERVETGGAPAVHEAPSDGTRATVAWTKDDTPTGHGLGALSGWGDDEPLVGTGVGATLALLRQTGDLRHAGVTRQAGRANDARDGGLEDAWRIKTGVTLDYRDEFGRVVTKKEAFRMLSYKFHGHAPGKKKQDKRLRQVKDELAAQHALSGQGRTKLMKGLERKQQQTKEAHVVLSSGG